MSDLADALAKYVIAKGYLPRKRIVLVEGTTDCDTFKLAAKLELSASGEDILRDLAFVAAGIGNAGGTNGVVREMFGLRAFASTVLDQSGRPVYRVCALLDNDKAGREALKSLHQFDISIIQYRDVFLLSPEMPKATNRDPLFLKNLIELANEPFKGIDWEIEDFFPQSFISAFEGEFNGAIRRKSEKNGKCHHDFTADGKARFHHFAKVNAIRDDLTKVVTIIRSLRSYLGLD